ncbi:MAG: hypothetical protein IJC76_01875 [Lachnospiraceae bacterium]|nr:hypothetical protein [Lachnospiraceae bacterium]
MQVNLNNILPGNKVNSIYRNDVQKVSGSYFDASISDEYTIKSANTMPDDEVITRVKQQEKEPIALTQENIKTLSENIGANEMSKYEELGITPEQDELGRVVTVAERIKIQLATHCENYKGDLSNISDEQLKEIYGEAGVHMAKQQMQAMEMAKELKNLDDNSKTYILKNEMTPSIENVYMAEHSGNASNVNKLTDAQWQELKPQVASTVEKVGIQATEEVMNEGRFLIEHGIPLTAENIMSSMEMNVNIEGRTNEQWLNDIAKTMTLGMSPTDTLVTGNVPDMAMVEDIITALENGNEEQVNAILQSGKEVTVLNLKNPPTLEEIKEKIADERLLAAREKLEEIRQKMSYESCITMLKHGIKVEITTIEVLAVTVDDYNKNNAMVFMPDAEDTALDLFNDTLNAMEQMKSVPSAVLGRVYAGQVEFSIGSIVSADRNYTVKYAEAEMLYTSVGTEVRRDLGDSIGNAFANSYEMLSELGIEITESSKRAVRILGYNEMEITEESIAAIQGLEEQVGKLFRNLTPQATAYLIENDINPLETDIVTLNDNLTELNMELGYAGTESFSKFLWKLDKNNGISKEDRAAYIGLYKLINRIEKGDHKAIGRVLKSGQEMTLKNLYHAIQNDSYKGKEFNIDDDFGLTESITIDENNLSQQLSHFEKKYSGMTDKVWHYTSPAKMQEIGLENYQNMPLDELAKAHEQENISDDYYQMKLSEMQEARYVTEESIQMLMNSDLTLSASNMLAMNTLVNSSLGIWGKLRENNKDIVDKLEEIDMENIEEEYKEAMEFAEETLVDNSNEMDVQQFRMFNRTIRLMGTLSKKQSYFVPVDIHGESSTMKVTFVKDSENKGRVSIDIYSEKTGKISVQFKDGREGLSCNAFTESNEGMDVASRAVKQMEEEFGEIKLEKGIIKNIRGDIFANEENVSASTKRLYHIAKSFYECVKNN